MKKLYLIGYASGLAGADAHCSDGPEIIRNSPHMSALEKSGVIYQWAAMVKEKSKPDTRVDQIIHNTCTELAKLTSELTHEKKYFIVLGGDHACALGTWSGVQDAIQQEGELGLIWIDAHMDAHTPETSESGRIHGMPVAHLLGFGYPTLTNILNSNPKLKPENICLIGVRSFESGEAEFLKNQKVKIYFMDEVKKRGFFPVLQEAVETVKKNTVAFGISLDLDGIDPEDAPGVDVPEKDGIRAQELMDGLQEVANDPKLIATEIVEFDPLKDKEHRTEKLVTNLLELFAKGKGLND